LVLLEADEGVDVDRLQMSIGGRAHAK